MLRVFSKIILHLFIYLFSVLTGRNWNYRVPLATAAHLGEWGGVSGPCLSLPFLLHRGGGSCAQSWPPLLPVEEQEGLDQISGAEPRGFFVEGGGSMKCLGSAREYS